MPAGKAAAFIRVQAQLPLEVLVDALRSPALHHPADELLLRPGPRQGNEEGVGGLGLSVSPFNEQPQRILLALRDARGDDSTESKTRRQVLLGALTPGAPPEALPLMNAQSQVRNALRVTLRVPLFIQQADGGLGATATAECKPRVGRCARNWLELP